MIESQVGTVNTEILTSLYTFIFYFLIFLFVATFVVYLLYRYYKSRFEEKGGEEKGKKEEESGENALEILNKRYAKGEIDREEYKRRKKELE